MTSKWSEALISKIQVAIYVAPDRGRHIHKNRDFHGLVLNDGEGEKNYIFSDGTVLHTVGGSFFYLPKGSSYYVKSLTPGGCYCINFDSEIRDEPFVINFRSYDKILHNFKAAAAAWQAGEELKHSLSMRALYDAIYRMQKERDRHYMPDSQTGIILPAVEKMNRAFTDSSVTVEGLAAECGISSVYFRRIFLNKFGISPKEYLIKRRIEYAKALLSSRSFTVGEVALQCGYAEPCHFSREFSRLVGVSPTKYARML